MQPESRLTDHTPPMSMSAVGFIKMGRSINVHAPFKLELYFKFPYLPPTWSKALESPCLKLDIARETE